MQQRLHHLNSPWRVQLVSGGVVQPVRHSRLPAAALHSLHSPCSTPFGFVSTLPALTCPCCLSAQEQGLRVHCALLPALHFRSPTGCPSPLLPPVPIAQGPRFHQAHVFEPRCAEVQRFQPALLPTLRSLSTPTHSLTLRLPLFLPLPALAHSLRPALPPS